MGFPLYHNQDGSIGKVYKFGNDGATVTVNYATLVPLMDRLHKKWIKESNDFHKKLLSLGVKAYRVNDGWVDRKNCHVSFHRDDHEIGSYWHTQALSVGDKIFIGDIRRGGRFAEITSIEDFLCFYEYGYKPLNETLDGEDDGLVKPYLTKYTIADKLSWWKRVFGDYQIQVDIYGEQR